MRRYTLNERGRTIFIYWPTVILIALVTGTNIVEVIIDWIFA